MENRTIWLRLGVTISASKKDIESLLNGDEETLKRLIRENKFVLDGESYIPTEEVDAYNDEHGTDFCCEDVEFCV